MDVKAIDLPDEFVEFVRDSLIHLYDLAYLQTRVLPPGVFDSESGASVRGRLLRQALLDAIDALHPDSGVAATSRAWRLYRILELRYLEGHEVIDVISQVALSKSQYHREHHRALEAVSSILWEQWRLAGHWNPAAPDSENADSNNYDLTRLEAETLMTDDGAGQSMVIDPVEVIRGVVALLQPLSSRHDVNLRLDIAEHLPSVQCERVALRQALLTILAHAINLRERSDVHISVVYVARHLEIRMSGHGAGAIRPDDLGVDESRPFVEALKAELSYEPPGRQTTRWAICLTLPANSPRTLLVVDNNTDFVRLVERYLVIHDWDVIGASDVDQAYGIALHQKPQAILLDVVIPGRDGWDLLVELKGNPSTRNIPVIVCSVLAEPEVAISLGATSYLQKPIDQGHLYAALSPFK
jgi:CheY-like chemotaxis protein